MNYRSFGFVPEGFKCSIPKRPYTAKSGELANWYNSVLDKLNEAYSDKSYNGTRPFYWRGTPILAEKGYITLNAKAVQCMKEKKNDIPWFFEDVYAYIRNYELEKYLSTAPELEDFRKVIEKLSDLRGHLHYRVSGPDSLDFESPINWNSLLNLKGNVRSHYTFEFKFTENFGQCTYRLEPEGQHFGWFNLWWEGGQFVFPVKDDPLCWNGHERINSGWDRKTHAKLHMAGAATRTKKMGALTAKYLNESGLPELIKKYIFKEEAPKVNVATAPKILDPKEYGYDGMSYSIMEKIRIKGYCEPEQKDVQRMQKLIETGKEGEGVAAKITDKYKAARRYIAALKLKGLTPNFNYETSSYSGPFACFGNRAIELGVAPELIAEICN